MKNIPYYRKHVFGRVVEYVANPADAQIIRQLTGKLTIDSRTRELLRDISGGAIQFTEVPMP